MATNRLTPGREGYKILFNDNMVIMNYTGSIDTDFCPSTSKAVICATSLG